MDLKRLTEFVQFTHQVRAVQRAISIHGGDRAENDMEHSYQLALIAWFLNQKDHLGLDTYRVVGMGLVHDLVEVHAGDTYAFGTKEHRDSQAAREQAAVEQLAKEWPDFPALHELIAEYEACSTPEAQFVYSVDKLAPMLNNFTDGGRSWREQGVTLEQVRAFKVGKADRSPAVAPYLNELLRELEGLPELFAPPSPPAPHQPPKRQN